MTYENFSLNHKRKLGVIIITVAFLLMVFFTEGILALYETALNYSLVEIGSIISALLIVGIFEKLNLSPTTKFNLSVFLYIFIVGVIITWLDLVSNVSIGLLMAVLISSLQKIFDSSKDFAKFKIEMYNSAKAVANALFFSIVAVLLSIPFDFSFIVVGLITWVTVYFAYSVFITPKQKLDYSK